MKRIFVNAVFQLIIFSVLISVFSGCQSSTDKKRKQIEDERRTYFEIDEVKISLRNRMFNRDGFLEINLNIDNPNQSEIPYCKSAFLTFEESDSPVYIEALYDNIVNSEKEYKLLFASTKSPETLCVEFIVSNHSKWYKIDLNSKECMSLDNGFPFQSYSAFDFQKLDNAANLIKSNIREFKPTDPRPMHFIVYATPVINPLTKRISTGGWTKTDRYLPVNTQDVIRNNGQLKQTGGLILTDNPNHASLVLILSFEYVDGGTFTYEDNSRVKQYSAINKFELYNLLSGESIKTEFYTNATYAGEQYSVALSSKGKQMFAGTELFIGGGFYRRGIFAKEFSGYVNFVSKTQ